MEPDPKSLEVQLKEKDEEIAKLKNQVSLMRKDILVRVKALDSYKKDVTKALSIATQMAKGRQLVIEGLQLEMDAMSSQMDDIVADIIKDKMEEASREAAFTNIMSGEIPEA